MPTDAPMETPEHVTAVMGRLRRWANRLRGRYGVPIYLCGSALRADNPDPRDWDIRIIVVPTREWRPDLTMSLPGCYAVQTCLVLRCMDCPAERPLFGGSLVLTPSRRYALRRQGTA